MLPHFGGRSDTRPETYEKKRIRIRRGRTDYIDRDRATTVSETEACVVSDGSQERLLALRVSYAQVSPVEEESDQKMSHSKEE